MDPILFTLLFALGVNIAAYENDHDSVFGRKEAKRSDSETVLICECSPEQTKREKRYREILERK